MTVTELQHTLETARWFNALGSYQPDASSIGLPDLSAWEADSPCTDPHLESLAQRMTWLPSESSQPDPFAPANAPALDAGQRKQVLESYKVALRSLRGAESDYLHVGPHDFTPAATGAAAYAARHAAQELFRNDGKPGPWCKIVELYARGFWPCGLLPDGRLVVL